MHSLEHTQAPSLDTDHLLQVKSEAALMEALHALKSFVHEHQPDIEARAFSEPEAIDHLIIELRRGITVLVKINQRVQPQPDIETEVKRIKKNIEDLIAWLEDRFEQVMSTMISTI